MASRRPNAVRATARALASCLTALLACASGLERGEVLYRQGDLHGALTTWRALPESSAEHAKVAERLRVVEAEFERLLLRYEKRALFFESEARLAEAVLNYRLALKLDPGRLALLDRAQQLVRELARQAAIEKRGLSASLRAGDLERSSRHAKALARLDPFDPALQINVRQVQAGVGEQILLHLDRGRRAYASGRRKVARRELMTVLSLDPRNQAALGYLSYIHRFEALEAQQKVPPLPDSITRSEILAEGHYRSAQAAETEGDIFWAITEYEAAIEVDASHPSAARDLDLLRSRARSRIDVLYAQGIQYFREEDLQNALRSWRRVLLIEPDHTRALEHVARAERMLTRLEEIQTRGS